MGDVLHKAPPGRFIVGEAIYSEDEWAPVGEPLETLEEAKAKARSLNEDCVSDLHYFVYDENGLVQEAA